MFSRRFITYILVAPLVLFLVLFFVFPIFSIIQKSIHVPEVKSAFPELAIVSTKCDGLLNQCDDKFSALATDLTNEDNKSKIAVASRKLNSELTGFRTLILKTARELNKTKNDSESDESLLISIDPKWSEARTWKILEQNLKPYTPRMLLRALDLRVNDEGTVSYVAENERIYLEIVKRTITLAGGITLIVIFIGYLFAAAINSIRSNLLRALCLFSVMLPFWTSLLVRTSSWIVILQREGILNSLLVSLGILDSPAELVFNRIGVIVVMVHVLLPFVVLPIYSVMRGISPSFVRAAASLGANPLRQFTKVYLPLTMPGVIAGGTITFIVALGYYITPSLVGGPKDQMLGYYIAYYTNVELNVGMSASLAVILLVITLALLGIGAKLVNARRIMSMVK